MAEENIDEAAQAVRRPPSSVPHEEMTEIRLGDQLTVRLEDVDLKERRINFTLLSNQNRRHPAKGGGHRRFDDDFWY